MARTESLRTNILLASAIPLLAMVLLAIAASWASSALSNSNARIEHRHDVIVSALQIQNVVADLERERNAFLATGNDELRAPYVAGKAALILSIEDTRALLINEPEQLARLKAVRDRAQFWIDTVAEPSIVFAAKLFNELQAESALEDLVAEGKGTWYWERIDQVLDRIGEALRRDGSNAGAELIPLLQRDQARVVAAERSFLLTGAPEFKQRLDGARQAFEEHRIALRDHVASRPIMAPLLDDVIEVQRLAVDWYGVVGRPEIEAREAHSRIGEAIASSRKRLLTATGNAVMMQLRTALNELVRAEERHMETLRRDATSLAKQTKWLLLVGSVITILGSLILMYFVARGITRPVEALVAATRKVADGDLDTRTAVDVSGEIGELARSFDRMVEDLQGLSARSEAARREAVEANNAKSNFLANMSHEIRTPMTAILGFSDVLLQPGVDDVQRRECVKTIRRNGEQLLRIINDILDLSKLEAGRFEIESLPVNPVELARETIGLMSVGAKSKGLMLELECVGRVPETVISDPTRLSQILINLVGNAIKFTARGGVTLRISLEYDKCVESAPAMLVVAVIDTGLGMAPELASGVFHAFRQADETVTRKFGGTGLGLAISRRFAKLLGGTIELESELGVGSTFTVRLPVGPASRLDLTEGDSAIVTRTRHVERRAEPRTNSTARVLDGVRMLLAEDGPDNQRLISLFLKKAGAEVSIVDNGQRAIEAIETATREGTPFDIVLMDMQMPVMDGYTAASELRARGAELPIIAITAHAMTGDRERCIEAGCTGYETKPIRARSLIETVRGIVRGAGESAESPESPESP